MGGIPYYSRAVTRDPRLAPYFGSFTGTLQRARLRAAARWLERGRRVLDVGCGLTDLASRLSPYVGCDRNPEVLAMCRARFPEARFVAWDVSADGPPGELAAEAPFDVILMLAILEHLSDPGTALGRAATLLAPGGPRDGDPHPLGHLPLELARVSGLLSKHADEEHEDSIARPWNPRAARPELRLATYRRFLFGAQPARGLRTA
jgi:SAM-dependent methyltransferase